jgi:hemerythrin-like domain-containing protein
MIVAELFTTEHTLFRVLLDRLELDLAQQEDRARADVSDALRALLPLLDRHAEIEDIVFRFPPDGVDDDPKALSEVAAQHRELAALRNEILFALERSFEEYPFARLRALTESLINDLRLHLVTEETRLWPFYQGALKRPLDAVVPIHLEKRAQVLEKELDRVIAAISHSASVDSKKP